MPATFLCLTCGTATPLKAGGAAPLAVQHAHHGFVADRRRRRAACHEGINQLDDRGVPLARGEQYDDGPGGDDRCHSQHREALQRAGCRPARAVTASAGP